MVVRVTLFAGGKGMDGRRLLDTLFKLPHPRDRVWMDWADAHAAADDAFAAKAASVKGFVEAVLRAREGDVVFMHSKAGGRPQVAMMAVARGEAGEPRLAPIATPVFAAAVQASGDGMTVLKSIGAPSNGMSLVDVPALREEGSVLGLRALCAACGKPVVQALVSRRTRRDMAAAAKPAPWRGVTPV